MKLARKQRRQLYKQHQPQPWERVISNDMITKECIRILANMYDLNKKYDESVQKSVDKP